MTPAGTAARDKREGVEPLRPLRPLRPLLRARLVTPRSAEEMKPSHPLSGGAHWRGGWRWRLPSRTDVRTRKRPQRCRRWRWTYGRGGVGGHEELMSGGDGPPGGCAATSRYKPLQAVTPAVTSGYRPLQAVTNGRAPLWLCCDKLRQAATSCDKLRQAATSCYRPLYAGAPPAAVLVARRLAVRARRQQAQRRQVDVFDRLFSGLPEIT